jgi:hypothetical protein
MRGLLLVVGLALAGCGNSQDVGVECLANADCDIGLSCLQTQSVGSNGTCSSSAKKVCTKQCVSDSECLKSAPVCVTSCLGLKTCAAATR